jgi:hypothetical protein
MRGSFILLSEFTGKGIRYPVWLIRIHVQLLYQTLTSSVM